MTSQETENARGGSSSVQRSFRLSSRTMRLLDERASELQESRNGLAERLLHEGLHTERHPLVVFREGASAIRRPAIVGTRLSVSQVVDTVRANANSIAETAEYLGLSEQHVRAAVAYYADYTDEVDEQAAADNDYARRERERWERSQRVLG